MSTPTDSAISVFSNAGPVSADTSQITQAGGTVVQRQRLNISDPSDPNAHAAVLNQPALGYEYGAVVRDAALEKLLAIQLQMLAEFREFKLIRYAQISSPRPTALGGTIVATGGDVFNVTNNNLEVGLAAAAAPTKMIVLGTQHNTTLPTPTNAQTVALQGNQAGSVRVDSTGILPTYSQAFAATSAQMANASATDSFTIYGSASKTIKILRIALWASGTTAGSQLCVLISRSSADTGGTVLQSGSGASHDQNDAGGTATVRQYSANPTLGTTVAIIRQIQLAVQTPDALTSAGTGPDRIVWNFIQDGGKPLVLRGTAQGVAINFNAAALVANATWEAEYTWMEDDS